MYGTQKIKEALDFGFGFAQTIKEALADDGKISGIGEYIKIAKSVKPALEVIKSIGEMKDEFVDLDPMERDEIVEYFSEKFDLDNDEVELKIEKAFALLLSIADFVVDEF